MFLNPGSANKANLSAAQSSENLWSDICGYYHSFIRHMLRHCAVKIKINKLIGLICFLKNRTSNRLMNSSALSGGHIM